MEHYAELDVSLHATAVYIIDERGRVVIESKFPVNHKQLPVSSDHKLLH